MLRTYKPPLYCTTLVASYWIRSGVWIFGTENMEVCMYFSFREVVFYGEVNRLTNKRVGESKMKDYQEDKKTEETA